MFQLTHDVCTIEGTRELSSVHVWGDGNNVRSSNEHWTRGRVTWDGGGSDFQNFDIDVYPGDRVLIIWSNGMKVYEENLTTGRRIYNKIRDKMDEVVIILSVISIVFMGIGLILTPMYIIHMVKRNKKRRDAITALAGNLRNSGQLEGLGRQAAASAA